MDHHLGFGKHEHSDSSNNRNGYTSKTLQTEEGQFEVATPRDREGSFEPQLVKKHQRRFTSMDDKILFLYAQGMSTREIVKTFKEMYGADVSVALISKVTDAKDYLKPGVTSEILDAVAHQISDNQAAEQLQKARRKLFKIIHGQTLRAG
jgi:transposase-like protein